MTRGLVAALDRTTTTSRNVTSVLSETAPSLGHNLDTVNISRSSIHRARTKFSMFASTSLNSDLCAAVPVTIHWDGKLLQDLTTNEYVDRLH